MSDHVREHLRAQAAPDAALREALELIAGLPPIGEWNGWREAKRLRDIARAALRGRRHDHP